MSDWLEQAVAEEAELSARIGRLQAFLDAQWPPSADYGLLSAQRDAMQTYRAVLRLRIRLAQG